MLGYEALEERIENLEKAIALLIDEYGRSIRTAHENVNRTLDIVMELTKKIEYLEKTKRDII